MGHAGYEVVLLRHGQTVGYENDLGLTDLGEQQASERGKALAAELEPGTRVVLPHARSARATATAVVLRRELLAALGDASGVDVGTLYPEPWFDNLRISIEGESLDANVAMARRLRLPDGELPDWARELDRFDTDHRAIAAAGGPIEFWVSTPTTFFEPPNLTVHRLWAGITALAPDDADERRVALVATHSAPMRAFLNAVLGRDPGEPENLEDVRIRVAPDGAATVTYRGEQTAFTGPPPIPPWFDAAFLAAHGRP
ncbi:broad specificity phosphatase PhoE [Pseudonocardia sediminis]|uniref:Broad specificity phosphatase PhoE n=1 Tax=Pseudonocardia sediminis TaxID=1397368 RepID=A0A4Q7UU89_PSEST|nr:phosphoglycerate mutase family protein [Pseudonocardia sediminis]RZT84468.1 broad specificity phosphatase PhoE [Pseudonocardia sediminis]